MILKPEISVVMSVFNNASTLQTTLDSILSQRRVEFEFIVIDDGSTDGSGEILEQRAAQDLRLKVIHQANSGLTRSLQRACDIAKGEFIARQDAGGDRSLDDRLAIQVQLLRDNSHAVFATCAHRLVCDDGTFLCDVQTSESEIIKGLSTLRLPGLRGILHASSMFRTDAFRNVGGYRLAFRVAQDIDLWLRMFECGTCAVTSEVLYECRHEANGISATKRAEQMALAKLAARCAAARRAGLPEPELVSEPDLVSVESDTRSRQLADYHYFIGACLRRRDPHVARRHFIKAWRYEPTRVKALILAALAW